MDAWQLVIADMEARRQLGLQRYAKPVSADDPDEDWLRHRYEEMLDDLVYTRASIAALRDLRAEVGRLRAALLAETERCAAVADSFGAHQYADPKRVAAAIRGGR